MNTGSALLPEPDVGARAARLPKPTSAALAERLGVDVTELERVEEIEGQLRAAVAELRASRPGGETWQAAARADLVAVESGRKPGQLAKLITGDPVRWGTVAAHVALREKAVTAFDGQAGEMLRLTVRTATRAGMVAAERELLPIAEQGWVNRADKAQAWAARNEIDKICLEIGWLAAASGWAHGGRFDSSPKARTPGGRAGGFVFALRAYLDRITVWTIPDGIELPDGWGSEPPQLRTADLVGPGIHVLPARG